MHPYIFLLVLFCAYLAGSIPSGYLVARSQGVDIRKVGSGNIGGTNVTRNLGIKWGALVGAMDFFKSYIPSMLAGRYFHTDWQALLVALMPVLGHLFPIWLNFKGGKGVATIFGILAAYFGFSLFLLGLVLWYLAVKLVKLMSLVNLGVGLLIPILFWLVFNSPVYIAYGGLLCVLIWWSHRTNIQRLLAGNETPTNY